MASSSPKASQPAGHSGGEAANLRPATIRDVARVAGVSRMTVSRVLNEPDLVKLDTRERVLNAVAKLGYVPDRAAGSLTTRRSGFVGLVLPTITDSTFAMVAHGLSEVLRAAEFQLLIGYHQYSLAEEETQIRDLLARRPEAILLFGTTHSRASTAMLMRADIPVIELADTTGRAIQHAIGYSNYDVGRMAARHLIKQGFREIGVIAPLPADERADLRGEARVRGFEDELRANELSTDSVMRQTAFPLRFADGATGLSALLAKNPTVEAVFCITDKCAVGVVMECQRRGIDIPGQLSVLGFGDSGLGSILNPPLSTIRVDFHDIGRRAGQLAIALLAGESDLPAAVDVEPGLIVRGSVRLTAHP